MNWRCFLKHEWPVKIWQKRGRLAEKTEIQTIDRSPIDCEPMQLQISMTSVLVPFLLYLRPSLQPFLSMCLYVCHSQPHPHTLTGKYILSQTLHCHHGNLWPLTSLCCCSSVLVSLFSPFFYLCLSLSVCFVWLVMSELSNYVSIFNVVLIVLFILFFPFFSFWFVFFFLMLLFLLSRSFHSLCL